MRDYAKMRPYNIRQADYYNVAQPKNKPYCIECNRIGHTVNRCYFRRDGTFHNFRNPSRRNSPRMDYQSSRYYNRQNPQQIRGQYERNNYRSRRNGSRWCVVHQSSGHNTNNCSIILRKRDEYRIYRHNRYKGTENKTVKQSKIINPSTETTKSSIISALQKEDILSVPWRIGKCKLTLAVDTGACANIISQESLHELKKSMPYTK